MTKDLSFVGLAQALDRSAKNRRQELISLLPEGAQAKFHAVSVTQTDQLIDLSLKELINRIHPTHFLDSFSHMSKEDQKFYLSSFPETKQKEVQSELHLEFEPFVMQESLANFTLSHYCEESLGSESSRPPRSTLDDSPLLPLVDASYEQLSSLCELLGLYDIVYELKRILKGSILKDIEKALSDVELSYLAKIQKTSNPIHFANIGLSSWDGNGEELKQVLRNRGLNRLAKAMYHTSDATVWYVTHIMDVEMAREFHKLRTDINDGSIERLLMDQVMNTWKKVCTASH